MSNPFRKSTAEPVVSSASSTDINSPASAPHYELSEATPKVATSNPENLHKSNPFSAFYQHPSTRSSLERAQADSRTHLPLMRTSSNDEDLEAANNTGRSPPAIIVSEELEKYKSTSNQSSVRPSRTNTGLKAFPTTQIHHVPSRESVWPTREEQEAQAKLAKRSRLRKNWNCLSGLPRRQRLTIQVLLALLVIAAAVGIGVGISQAVGGTTYSNTPGQTNPIPDNGGQ